MFEVASSSRTETGKVRETNEDAVLEAGNLFAVADGMGGHQAGEVASNLALAVIGQYVEDSLGLLSGEKMVEKAIESANSAVFQKANSSARYRDMGTTITMLYREGDTAYIGQVGDSRAYLLRGGSLRRLTRDHSLVALLVEEGEITEEEARVHPQRNIILKALGLERSVEPEVTSVKIEPGDVFLLASDGLTGMVGDDLIATALASGGPVEAAEMLVDAAMGAGGIDNISVVVVRFTISDRLVPAGEPAGDTAAGPRGGSGEAAGRRRRGAGRKWAVLAAALVLLLAAAGGTAAYLYNNTFFVGAKDGRVTMFKGFPFWNLATVQVQTETQVGFLPEAVRERVEGRLETQSRAEAMKTLERLERQAAGNSVVVPNVEGRRYSEVKGELEGIGLKVEVELVSLPNAGGDTVIEQDPAPGARVGKGSTVKLRVVMSGTAPREV